jgi:hypothetical protein
LTYLEEHFHRPLSVQASVLCSEEVSDTQMHLLWDCTFAEECWDIILPERNRGTSINDEITRLK